jgi:hypothetical protein
VSFAGEKLPQVLIFDGKTVEQNNKERKMELVRWFFPGFVRWFFRRTREF